MFGFFYANSNSVYTKQSLILSKFGNQATWKQMKFFTSNNDFQHGGNWSTWNPSAIISKLNSSLCVSYSLIYLHQIRDKDKDIRSNFISTFKL